LLHLQGRILLCEQLAVCLLLVAYLPLVNRTVTTEATRLPGDAAAAAMAAMAPSAQMYSIIDRTFLPLRRDICL
jgi:hypothetical protein